MGRRAERENEIPLLAETFIYLGAQLRSIGDRNLRYFINMVSEDLEDFMKSPTRQRRARREKELSAPAPQPPSETQTAP